MLGVITPRRRWGRITRVRDDTRVLPKHAAPRYAGFRNIAQTTERSQRALLLRVGMPSELSLRVISAILRPSTVYISYTRCTTRASFSSTVYAAGAWSVLRK